jgi:hypothetical protein
MWNLRILFFVSWLYYFGGQSKSIYTVNVKTISLLLFRTFYGASYITYLCYYITNARTRTKQCRTSDLHLPRGAEHLFVKIVFFSTHMHPLKMLFYLLKAPNLELLDFEPPHRWRWHRRFGLPVCLASKGELQQLARKKRNTKPIGRGRTKKKQRATII